MFPPLLAWTLASGDSASKHRALEHQSFLSWQQNAQYGKRIQTPISSFAARLFQIKGQLEKPQGTQKPPLSVFTGRNADPSSVLSNRSTCCVSSVAAFTYSFIRIFFSFSSDSFFSQLSHSVVSDSL